jgi:hypothetical protein
LCGAPLSELLPAATGRAVVCIARTPPLPAAAQDHCEQLRENAALLPCKQLLRRRCMGLTVVCSPSARHRPWWPSTSACNDVNPRTISTGAGWKIRGATAAGAAARGLSTRPRAGGCLSAPAPPSAAAAVTEEQTAKGLAVARTALRCCLPGGLPPVSSRQRSSPPYCPVLVLAVRGEVAGLASSLARTM